MASSKATASTLSAEFSALVDHLRAETDRGCMLVAAAFLDNALEVLIRAAFVDNQKAAGRLLEYPGPCSTFAARSDLAYCMGLIDSSTHADLGTVRKIRNEFAHSHFLARFSSAKIKALCHQLRVISWMKKQGTRFLVGEKTELIITAAAIGSGLVQRAAEVQHAPEGDPLSQPDRNPFGY